MLSKVCYIDVETTGLKAGIHALLQIAYIIEIGGVVRKRTSISINPKSYKTKRKASIKALEVNNISAKDFDRFTNSAEAYKIFTEDLEKYLNINSKFTIVAYNSSFDIKFLQDWFNDLGSNDWSRYFTYKDLDVFALVKYLVATTDFNTGSSQNLESACRAIGLEFSGHDAAYDVEVTRDLHKYLVNTYIAGAKI